MGEKSEVQNLTEPTAATEPLDATPLAADAGQVQQGEPKAYPEDADGDDDEAYAAQDRPER
jgi:hypothetical protein